MCSPHPDAGHRPVLLVGRDQEGDIRSGLQIQVCGANIGDRLVISPGREVDNGTEVVLADVLFEALMDFFLKFLFSSTPESEDVFRGVATTCHAEQLSYENLVAPAGHLCQRLFYCLLSHWALL